MSDINIEGWGWPAAARKAHYFRAGATVSVCGRWMYVGPRDPYTATRSPDDCAACIKRLPASEVAS